MIVILGNTDSTGRLRMTIIIRVMIMIMLITIATITTLMKIMTTQEYTNERILAKCDNNDDASPP